MQKLFVSSFAVLLLWVVLFSATVNAQACSSLSSCGTCANNTACAWCPSKGQCFSSSNAELCPRDTVTDVDQCVTQDCDVSADCFSCAANSNCGFCSLTSSCLPLFSNTAETCVGQDLIFTEDKCPASVCLSFTNCTSCLNDPHCGWCASSGLCMAAAGSNPAGDSCPADWTTATCPADECAPIKNCTTCSERIAECGWCPDSQSCYQLNDEATCPNKWLISEPEVCTLPADDPCSDHTDCSSCSKDEKCGWCDTDNTCKYGDLIEGPYYGNCSTNNWKFTFSQCPAFQHCDQFTNCLSCALESVCGWCDSSQSCMPSNSSTCGSALMNNATVCMANDPCNTVSNNNNCTACTEGSCGYCLTSNTCLYGDSTGPLYSNCAGQNSWAFTSDFCPTPTPTPSPSNSSSPLPPLIGTVIYINTTKLPTTITIKLGETINWVNNDNVTHTITADKQGPFNSGDIAPGKVFSWTFTQPGTYAYHCASHPTTMRGLIVVLSDRTTSVASINGSFAAFVLLALLSLFLLL